MLELFESDVEVTFAFSPAGLFLLDEALRSLVFDGGSFFPFFTVATFFLGVIFLSALSLLLVVLRLLTEDGAEKDSLENDSTEDSEGEGDGDGE